MSFGTGHHETTHMMVQHLLALDLKNKKVLDMGCGTRNNDGYCARYLWFSKIIELLSITLLGKRDRGE